MNFFRNLSLGAILLILLASFSLAQEDPAELEFRNAMRVIRTLGQIEAGREQLERLIEEHPDSSWAVSARFQLGHLAGDDEAIPIYQSIADDFPGDLFNVVARLQILERLHKGELEAWLVGAEDILAEFDAPALGSVLDDNERRANLERMNAKTVEQRSEFGRVYSYAWSRIALGFDEPERALPLAMFMRSSLEPFGITSGNISIIQLELISRVVGDEVMVPSRKQDPTVVVTNPPGDQMPAGPVTLTATISSGDSDHVQVSLWNTKISLDGVDIKDSVLFHSEYDAELQEGVDFEKVYIEYRASGLSLGNHRLEIETEIENYRGTGAGQTRFVKEFEVTSTPEPEATTLDASRDTTLRAQKPHRNEGANPRLFLSHRLEARGKSNNPLVGFDLSDVNLSGLTKASLVMNIQDCDLPRRWGRNGRSIEVYPVSAAWTEGNGNRYRLNGQEGRTKGEGPGATWFSPTDEQIRNNRPNGSEQWNGARTFSGAATAPTVQVVNGQTGPIEFDVTNDVLAMQGNVEMSWLLKKQQEGKFGNIRFYSKENGNSELAPKLVLEFGNGVAARTMPLAGVGSQGKAQLAKRVTGSELPSLREVLKGSPAASKAAETLAGGLAGPNPALKAVARTAYRSWLNHGFAAG